MRTVRTIVTRLALAGAAFGAVACGPAPSPDALAAARRDTIIPVVVPTRDTTVVTVTSDTMTVGVDGRVTTTTVDTLQGGEAEPEPIGLCRMTDSLPPRPESPWGTPPTPADSAVMARGVAFRCPLRAGGREVRLVVSGEWGIPMGVDVFSPPDADKRSQQLLLDTDERAIPGRHLLEGEDLNDDGWTDLKVPTWSGTGGQVYDVFMYDPRRSAFVKDTVLSGGGGVVPREERPCVGTGWRSGISHHLLDEYCWSGGAWVLERADELNMVRSRPDCEYLYARSSKVRRNGRMQPVPLDTICMSDR
jgi:hypothetical protein